MNCLEREAALEVSVVSPVALPLLKPLFQNFRFQNFPFRASLIVTQGNQLYSLLHVIVNLVWLQVSSLKYQLTHVSRIIMLYTGTLHSAVCPLYLSKTGNKIIIQIKHCKLWQLVKIKKIPC